MNPLIFNPNNLMELRRKSSIADELAFTKSAAWAWLEHHSVVVSNEQTTPEVDVFRSEFNPKPSRYKVEAMNPPPPPPSKPKITNYTLLDRYDIERISRQLEFYIKSNGCRRTGGRRAEAVAVPMDTKRKLTAAPQKKKMSKGITRVPMVCGSSMDEVVDDYTTRRRRSECDRVSVVDLGCRPRHGVRA